ncbi:phosphatidate cytidylyltransferase [Sphingobacterium haloxyli]|uniref:Phosphatidate cytidylyltransferase n=1 Tax=Sphingobacterium haloxyli TaxID=2100533 RepID=A0A2S9J101_9SPHI|nr:phosphatidate cytidylyltransferase [Sphingobacterium haloxyli]PRD46457.1 phosphatidate cytidylyltransferase [Sphingobacterium haloxyli]
MKTRAITGFFFIAVLIGAVLLGPYVFVSLFSLIATYCVYEFYRMVHTQHTQPLVFLGVGVTALGLVLVDMVLLDLLPYAILPLGVTAVLLLYIAALFRKTVHPMQDVAYSLFGLIYAAIPFVFFMSLGFVNGIYNAYIPLGFLILLWTNDTGAYLAGRSIGRRKLFERISPNKTWEGFFGGAVFAALAGFVLSHYFAILPMWCWVCMGLIIAIFGTLGDLVESMLKRNVGVKDSGNLLPGHGGLLDRFDGLLVAAPLVYLFLKSTL